MKTANCRFSWLRKAACVVVFFLVAAPGAYCGRAAAGKRAVVADRGAGTAPSGPVVLDYQDLTGDGVPEVVIENAYLRVEIMTGRKPTPHHRSIGKVVAGLVMKKGPAKPRYDNRFVWAGWINNVTFKPTRQRWFADDSVHHWQGIPEEFGEAVKMRRTGRDTFDVIKVGIGICTGVGICHHSQLKLVKAFPWDRIVHTTPGGGKRVTFRQTATAELGYGYILEKEFRIEPSRSELVIRRRLRNTGIEPLHTTWYAHAFWAQATSGEGYDADSWTTIPIRYRGNGPRAGIVDTASCFLDFPIRYGIWGAIPSDLLAETWYASGNRKTGDFFLTRLDTPLAWDRVWTYESTYSCEPFVAIDLAPGQEKTWTIVRTLGIGLSGVRGAGRDGVLDWQFSAQAGTAGQWPLTVDCVTPQLQGGLTLAVEIEPHGTSAKADVHRAALSYSCGVPLCGPTTAFRRTFPGPSSPGQYRVRAVLKKNETTLVDVSRICEVGPDAITPAIPVRAYPSAATVFTGTPSDKKTGKIVPSRPAAYWARALRRAGFQVRFANPLTCKEPAPLWSVSRVAVLADVPRVPTYLASWLGAFVKAGNGLVVCAPFDLRPFEFSDLLPVARSTAHVQILEPRPRDGTREFIGDSLERYHLVAATSHPILRGLPLYPEVYQDIAQLYLVEAKPWAKTVLRYASGSLARPQVSSPALVVGHHGAGRVAVFASPVNWGAPDYWVLYSRLGEYHRKLLAQMALWAGGFLDEANDASGSK